MVIAKETKKGYNNFVGSPKEPSAKSLRKGISPSGKLL